MPDIPWLDPEIEYVAVSEISGASRLIDKGATCIITKSGVPFAVMVPYASYLTLQSLAELPKTRAAHGR